MVRGHVPWSHWQAISTSPDPASLQACPQYSPPGCAAHLHGRCAHLVCSVVVIVVSPFETQFLNPYGCRSAWSFHESICKPYENCDRQPHSADCRIASAGRLHYDAIAFIEWI